MMFLSYLNNTHKFISIFVAELHFKFQTTINSLVFMCESWFNLFQKIDLGAPFGGRASKAAARSDAPQTGCPEAI
jgi:hypothetical protein